MFFNVLLEVWISSPFHVVFLVIEVVDAVDHQMMESLGNRRSRMTFAERSVQFTSALEEGDVLCIDGVHPNGVALVPFVDRQTLSHGSILAR